MARLLAAHGHQVVVLDDLSTGHAQAVQWGRLVQADVLHPPSLEAAFAGQRFDAVFHFCARSLVAESMAQPYDYYASNVVGTLNLLEAMRRHGVRRLVFSSSASVYGQPTTGMVDEAHPMQPTNPYGASKLMVERILPTRPLPTGWTRSRCGTSTRPARQPMHASASRMPVRPT